MSESTAISWTDATFNPWWGCWPVSPGCALCYADREATRHGFPDLWKKPGPGAPPESNRRTFGEKHWNEPRVWARNLPRKLGRRPRVFCASMADIGEDHPVAAAERPKLWVLIEETPELDWLLLTKRIDTAAEWLPHRWLAGRFPVNVWLGISAEDQQRYDERAKWLAALAPPVSFISYEPALGPIDFRLGQSAWSRFDWIIAGGESAHPAKRARPAQAAWIRSARDQSVAAGVAFHFKQWGEWLPGRFDRRKSKMVCAPGPGFDKHLDFGRIFWTNPGEPPVKLWDEADHYWTNASALVGRKAAGRLLDGRTWDEFPVSLGAPPGGLCFDLPKAVPRG